MSLFKQIYLVAGQCNINRVDTFNTVSSKATGWIGDHHDSVLKVDTIQSSGGTTGLTIDSSGRVTSLVKPAFFAYLTTDQTMSIGSWDKVDSTMRRCGF